MKILAIITGMLTAIVVICGVAVPLHVFPGLGWFLPKGLMELSVGWL